MNVCLLGHLAVMPCPNRLPDLLQQLRFLSRRKCLNVSFCIHPTINDYKRAIRRFVSVCCFHHRCLPALIPRVQNVPVVPIVQTVSTQDSNGLFNPKLALRRFEFTSGISSHVLPSSSRPVSFFLVPPHCLKKNGNSLSDASIPNFSHPLGVHIPRPGT